MKVDLKIVICAIICLTVIQLYAMHCGIDGMFRSIITGAICLLAGLIIDTKQIFKREV